ncbi:hypothetical protein RJ639_016406 [Escallonia herrerae]|uniref:Reverse transcriptase RNase H-like domain-containing protein n=1 Tax=Escallonia herrerae TaxID=1293975 RepID=A0AA88VJI4_9ASTE|nr:hypothetical protein RJ639_016406 [Escallonia herrerae]
MKFPTEHGIGEAKGDQTTACQCYVTSCRSRNKEALIIEDLREDTRKQRGEPVEDLVNIEVYPGEENKTVWIGSNLKEDTKLELSIKSEFHVEDLRETFDILRKYRMKLNPLKCAFRVESGKFLGFIVSQRGIKANPEKIKAIQAMTPPKTIKQVQELIGRVAALGREEDGVQKPIYYVTKVLQDVETRYPKIDKIALALIISARRLRPYFQSHTIVVLTDQPLRKVLLSPEASGRLVNWSVELGEFDLQYKPHTKDAIEFTRRCDKCQKFAPLSHTPVAPLTSIVSPIPFAVCGMDLLGPFPIASGQRRFVIVAIDYFTKWTEAESLATITSAKCEDFFRKNVICLLECQELWSLITENSLTTTISKPFDRFEIHFSSSSTM